MGRGRCAIAAAGAALVLAAAVSAEPATTVVDSGDPANRLDIAVLGEGYTAAELAAYAADVDGLMAEVLAEPPFDAYAGYVNVHRVDVTSQESGADHPGTDPPTYVDTALDGTYSCAGIPSLICVDTFTVDMILAASLDPDEYDVILVLVNDSTRGGSGGYVAVSYNGGGATNFILHELGHSFGLLADEYWNYHGQPCDNRFEPVEPNATKETQRELIKWKHWIDPETPIPTETTDPGVPGLYQAARYCVTGLYRPTDASKMRILRKPFEQINSEQLVKRIYDYASPIDASDPAGAEVSLYEGETRLFELTLLAPASHALDVAWRLDGTPVGSGSQYLFDSGQTGTGSFGLDATVSDPTPLVRNDPAGALSQERSWVIEVPEPGRGLQLVSGCLALAWLARRRRPSAWRPARPQASRAGSEARYAHQASGRRCSRAPSSISRLYQARATGSEVR